MTHTPVSLKKPNPADNDFIFQKGVEFIKLSSNVATVVLTFEFQNYATMLGNMRSIAMNNPQKMIQLKSATNDTQDLSAMARMALERFQPDAAQAIKHLQELLRIDFCRLQGAQ